MAGIYYSIGPIHSTTLDASDIQTFINELYTILIGCRWTLISTISGSGSTTGYKLESFPTPALHSMRVSIWWDGTFQGPNPKVRFKFSDASEIYVTTKYGSITISSGKAVRVIAGPHQFFVFYEGSSFTGNPNLNSVSCGVPVLSLGSNASFWASYEFLSNLIVMPSFRNSLVPQLNENYSFLLNGIFLDGDTTSVAIAPQLLSMRGSKLLNTVRFYGETYPVILPKMAMGLTTSAFVNVVPIWDAFVACFRVDTKITVLADGRMWESYTLGSDCGSLFLASENVGGGQRGFSY